MEDTKVLNEARNTIRDEASKYADVVSAGHLLIHSPDCTFHDLLLCIGRGGLCAEWASIRLHARTGRPLPNVDGQPGTVMDYEDWVEYLKRSGHLMSE